MEARDSLIANTIKLYFNNLPLLSDRCWRGGVRLSRYIFMLHLCPVARRRIFEVRFFAWRARACARGGAGTTQKEDPGYVISLRSGKKTPITVRAGSGRITISRSPRRGLTRLAIDGAQHSHDEVRSENHTHKRAPDAGAKAQQERMMAPEARTTLTRCSRQSKLGTCHRRQKREQHSQDGTRQRVLKKMSNSGGDASNGPLE
ncbi:unnamed protein product [Trichogramma brassicae]|uniref:Uncharacterized protein n=1 Tax=Trichogramma brassicae TaxID=86971 RepID=A0A6H5I636_9HYME|nr:unnamed protein product [Trichogramma brassicae]